MESGRILLMRHAEKPDDPRNPALSDAGRERAGKLARYLPGAFRQPDFLFASAITDRSRRSYETLEPLANGCGMAIDASFANQDYSALVHEIRTKPQYNGKLIVVCWHHGNIPSLAHKLKVKRSGYPDPWDALVFNLILQFDFLDGAANANRVIEPF